MKKVLLVGESWHVHVTEAKGFDVFTYDYYEEATEYIRKAMEKNGVEFVHIPSHMVQYQFPTTVEALKEYDVVIFSDVGANTMNLPMNTFQRGRPEVNRLEVVKEYVRQGGAFAMIGGYLTFQGIQARGAYKRTAIEEILPVTLLEGDDRVERCEGAIPVVVDAAHPTMANLPESWPAIFGYNRLIPKQDSQVVAKVMDDPMVVLGTFGQGRVCAYATDCAPHWSPEEFCNWEGYPVLWDNLVNWLTESK